LKTEGIYTKAEAITLVGINRSKYYHWNCRRGIANRHNGEIPCNNRLTPQEKADLISYAKTKYSENTQYLRIGYRRLAHEMLDKGIVVASSSTVYNVLKPTGLLNRWNTTKTSRRGTGYIQPEYPHQEWHTDIKYVLHEGNYVYFISVLDGYSRYSLHHELRLTMTELDAELIVQKALDKYPNAKPKVISDNGSQYKSREFRKFIREAELAHTKTSPAYPQSNGKIERFHRSYNEECIETKSMLSLNDLRNQTEQWVNYYNTQRAHSSLYYLTPEDFLTGRADEKLKIREDKVKQAIEARRKYWEENKKNVSYEIN
jgi:putative transposase